MQDYRKLAAWQRSHALVLVTLAGDLGLLSQPDRKELEGQVSDVKAVITRFMKSVIAAIESGAGRR